MRRSTLRLYGPFIALAAVQALFIVAAPSKAPDRTALSAGAGGFKAGGTNNGFASSNGGLPGATGSDGTPGGAGGGGGGSNGGGGGGGGNATSNVGGGGLAAGDTSHCAGPYQFDILLGHGPPCQPAFAGDNGGATYDGVTGDAINVIFFQSTPNEQVNTILGAKGLATTPQDQEAAVKVFTDFINTHYELYGRKINVKMETGDCPTTPPDYAKCEVAAQQVVKEHPFMVIWITSLYADVFDIWANAGIISLGGSSFDQSFYTQRRPFRYDVAMDGSQSADFISEYYCKKMVGKHPDHAGSLIKADIGTRDSVIRKLGVISPEIPADTATAQRVIDAVRQCGGPDAAVDHPFTYKSDINSATTQTEATVAALGQNKVTTIVCMCDPIAPVFLTQGLSSQRYFPEHVLPGLGLLDYDLLGQLYDPQQWQHAFGPSQLPIPTTLDDGDPARVWRAMGNQSHPCGNNGCGLEWAFLSEMAVMLQQTGPTLNPLTFEQGVLTNIPASGGSGKLALYQFGPNDYTAESDEKEVYWDPTATTPTDGSKGAYIAVGGEQRYQLGQWGTTLDGIPIHA